MCSTRPFLHVGTPTIITVRVIYGLHSIVGYRLSDITVWGSDKEKASTTAYPSTADWKVIPTQKDKMDILRVIELNNTKRFRHIAVSKEMAGIVSLKEVQIFSKKKWVSLFIYH